MKIKMEKPKFLIEAENKVKEIWNILQDKRAVRFTLSVKLSRADLIEPKIFVMQGERAPDGGWNTWFSKDQNPDTLQSRETLKEKLASIEERVREYIVENALNSDWKKQEASISAALESGLSVEDLECRSEYPGRAIAAYGYDAHFCAPVMATVYAREGAEALAKNDLNHASYCVDRGLYWSSPAMFILNPNDRFVERARTGGLGKDLLREPVQQKVAELLTSLAPDEGWASTPNAIHEVAKKLTFSHSKFVEDCQLKTDNLPKIIQGWIQLDPERFVHRIKSKT
ncbi:hypothetical protein [Undibacterium sp. Ren11W]|uniref:hypothetical protein n=1 Tax=Undibacterium sp. Ren11W TaxID=3413045 RepID=UPI003BF0F128